MPNQVKDFMHPEYGRLRIYQTAGAVLGRPDHVVLLMTPRDDETEAAFRRMAGGFPSSMGRPRPSW